MQRIVFLVFPGCITLDLAGPLQVFSTAARLGPAKQPRYRVELVTGHPGKLATSEGLDLHVGRSLKQCRGPIDTLIVVSGIGIRRTLKETAMIAWLARAARRSRRVASICGAAFLLAEAGLLDGKRAVTHWAVCGGLSRHYPSVKVEVDPIYVRDGQMWTSAGVTAGIDLALAMVAEDHGRDVALEVARWLVLFLHRSGGQSQFSVELAAQVAQREPFRELSRYIGSHLRDDLSVPALARRVGMSVRNFSRAFGRDLGTTPRDHVERARVEAARRLLEESRDPVEEVAARIGFGTVEALERAFQRILHVTPRAYRRQFRKAV